jgi:predicted  nucleic acid-binding Zn-ribbon protein
VTKEKKMYRTFDVVNGIPPRIYRAPREVRRDIDEISAKIKEANLRLNLRALVIDIVSSEKGAEPSSLITELEAAIDEAREALEELRNLENELTALEYEMGELKWLAGR